MMIEERLQTPIKEHCDVLVCGGGIAGIAAAISAAREGARVLLLERGFLLGGLATAGLITIYLPLCDGLGRQVSFGIAEELLRLSVAEHCDGKRGVVNWLLDSDPAKRGEKHPRFEVNFNPQLFAIAAEQQLLSLGVRILYGVCATAARVESGCVTAVLAEGKGGRFGICARAVVDATGDADLAHFTGVPTATLGQGNVLAAWYYSVGADGYRLRALGASDIPDSHKTAQNAPRLLSDRRFAGLEDGEISEMMQLSHGVVLDDVRRRRKADATLEPVTVATVPQLRMTRRAVGAYTLSEGEVHRYFEDSIGMVSDWRRRGPVFEVPFGTLYSPTVQNLFFAGRCTSVEDAMWDIMRVIPCCAVTGEAAGIAAALAGDTAPTAAAVQAVLRERGIPLHEAELENFEKA